MEIKVHRGTNEIGASCLEIHSKSSRILIDIGLPLDGSEANLPEGIEDFDAIFISHCHQDHSGLLDKIPENVPVYIGNIASEFIKASRLFVGKKQLSFNSRPILAWKKIKIGKFSVFPYLVDHSAPEAFSFLIDDGSSRLFYSGDFRSHGRKSVLFKNLCERPPSNVDVLVLEGTMVNRNNSKFPDEESIEKEMVNVMSVEDGLVFLVCSGQNIDRIVSAYRAACRCNRLLTVDIYTAWILEIMGASGFSVPTSSWEKVRVLCHGWPAKSYYLTMKNHPEIFENFVKQIYSRGTAIALEEIENNPKQYLLKISPGHILNAIDCINLESSTVLYSQWDGYLTEKHNESGYKVFLNLMDMSNVNFKKIHTSGHAVIEDLEKLTKSIRPKVVIPIHTEHKQKYNDLFENVKILEDGETFVCPVK